MGMSFMSIEKIKSINNMTSKYKHNYRTRYVRNADVNKSHLNEELVSLNGIDYKTAFDNRLMELPYYKDGKKIRSNQVLGYEVLTTFSREEREHLDVDKWKQDNISWLYDTFGKENVPSVMFHGDECGNVHIHAFVVPIDPEGHLNARHYTGGRQKMLELQNSYGEKMKKEHGLNRGIRASGAKHRDIKKFYAALNQSIDNKIELLHNRLESRLDLCRLILENQEANVDLDDKEKLKGIVRVEASDLGIEITERSADDYIQLLKRTKEIDDCSVKTKKEQEIKESPEDLHARSAKAIQILNLQLLDLKLKRKRDKEVLVEKEKILKKILNGREYDDIVRKSKVLDRINLAMEKYPDKEKSDAAFAIINEMMDWVELQKKDHRDFQEKEAVNSNVFEK